MYTDYNSLDKKCFYYPIKLSFYTKSNYIIFDLNEYSVIYVTCEVSEFEQNLDLQTYALKNLGSKLTSPTHN